VYVSCAFIWGSTEKQQRGINLKSCEDLKKKPFIDSNPCRSECVPYCVVGPSGSWSVEFNKEQELKSDRVWMIFSRKVTVAFKEHETINLVLRTFMPERPWELRWWTLKSLTRNFIVLCLGDHDPCRASENDPPGLQLDRVFHPFTYLYCYLRCHVSLFPCFLQFLFIFVKSPLPLTRSITEDGVSDKSQSRLDSNMRKDDGTTMHAPVREMVNWWLRGNAWRNSEIFSVVSSPVAKQQIKHSFQRLSETSK